MIPRTSDAFGCALDFLVGDVLGLTPFSGPWLSLFMLSPGCDGAGVAQILHRFRNEKAADTLFRNKIADINIFLTSFLLLVVMNLSNAA